MRGGQGWNTYRPCLSSLWRSASIIPSLSLLQRFLHVGNRPTTVDSKIQGVFPTLKSYAQSLVKLIFVELCKNHTYFESPSLLLKKTNQICQIKTRLYRFNILFTGRHTSEVENGGEVGQGDVINFKGIEKFSPLVCIVSFHVLTIFFKCSCFRP